MSIPCKRTFALSAALLLAAIEAGATQEAFKVYCVAGGGAKLMMSSAVDSAADLRKALRESPSLTLVDSKDAADVVVRVLWRDDMVHPQLGGTRRPYKTVFATLESKNDQVELLGIGDRTWRSAAASLVTRIERAVDENRDRWLESDDGSGGSERSADGGSRDGDGVPVVEIFRGMKSDDVERLLGAPNQSVKFGMRMMWEYAGFGVVLEGGTVVDVTF